MIHLKKLPNWFSLVVILILALLLRIPLLNGSFWLDEAAQALESARPFSQQLQIRDDFQPPLLHIILHLAQYLGDSEWWLRSVGALVPGLVTIFYTYRIALLLKDKKAAVFAALLIATSSFHIFYSQELRQYSLPAAFATATWFILISAWKRGVSPYNNQLVTFSLLQAAGLYSSYLYPFAMIGQGIWLLMIYRRDMLRWIAAYSLSVILFIPWVPYFLDQLSAGTELRSSLPGWETVVSPTQLRALPLVISKFLYGVADVELNVLFISSSLILLFLVGWLIIKKPFSKSEKIALSPVLCWLFVPVLAAWLVSFAVPVLQPKRVLFCLPAFYLLLTILAPRVQVSLKKISFMTTLPVLVSVMLLINTVTVVQYWTTPLLQRENWRTLVAEIHKKYPERAVAVFSFPEPFAPWRWYSTDNYPVIATKQLLLEDQQAISTIKQATEYEYIITLDYLRDLTDPEHKLNKLLIDYGYKEIEVIDYPVIGFVRIYSQPEAVISYK